MRVFVQRQDNSRVYVDLWRSITVQELKDLLLLHCPSVSEPFHLLFNGQLLTELDLTLEELNIQQGDVLVIWHERIPNADDRLDYLKSSEGIPNHVFVDPDVYPVQLERPARPDIQIGIGNVCHGQDEEQKSSWIPPMPNDGHDANPVLTQSDVETFCHYYVFNSRDVEEEFTTRFPEAARSIRRDTFREYLAENPAIRRDIEGWLKLLKSYFHSGPDFDEELATAVQLSFDAYFRDCQEDMPEDNTPSHCCSSALEGLNDADPVGGTNTDSAFSEEHDPVREDTENLPYESETSPGSQTGPMEPVIMNPDNSRTAGLSSLSYFRGISRGRMLELRRLRRLMNQGDPLEAEISHTDSEEETVSPDGKAGSSKQS